MALNDNYEQYKFKSNAVTCSTIYFVIDHEILTGITEQAEFCHCTNRKQERAKLYSDSAFRFDSCVIYANIRLPYLFRSSNQGSILLSSCNILMNIFFVFQNEIQNYYYHLSYKYAYFIIFL